MPRYAWLLGLAASVNALDNGLNWESPPMGWHLLGLCLRAAYPV